MRITNPNDEKNPFYAGICKGNTAPKHVTKEGVTTAKTKIDKSPATMYDSPKSKDYIYIQCGENWFWVKDKSIMGLAKLTTTKIVKEAEVKAEEVTTA